MIKTKKIEVCTLKDCKFQNTPGCRVYGLNVYGIKKCEKYLKKPLRGKKRIFLLACFLFLGCAQKWGSGSL